MRSEHTALFVPCRQHWHVAVKLLWTLTSSQWSKLVCFSMKSNFWHDPAKHQDTDTIYYVLSEFILQGTNCLKAAKRQDEMSDYSHILFFFFKLRHPLHCSLHWSPEQPRLSSGKLMESLKEWVCVLEVDISWSLELISIMNLSQGVRWGDWQKMEWCNKKVNKLPWETGSCWKMNMTQEIRLFWVFWVPSMWDWTGIVCYFVFGIVNGKWSGGSIMGTHRQREIAHLKYMTQLIETNECLLFILIIVPLSVQ